MSLQTRTRSALAAAALATVCGISAAPASAQGFFDQIFGTRPAQQPFYNSGPLPQDVIPSDPTDVPRVVSPKRVVEEKPVLQKPTDLMHDKTLHVGDAVMMKDGIHVYAGPQASKHSQKQFVPLDDAQYVDSKSRVKLAELDVARSESVREGRSTTEIVQGFKITDAHGNSIRYVGP